MFTRANENLWHKNPLLCFKKGGEDNYGEMTTVS